jgi:YD repeat-containing protein
MVWFFSRDEKDLRIETRYDNDAADYVLVVHWPDGRVQTEHFSTASQFRVRLIELQKYIEDEGWRSSRSPEIIADGWRIAH